jgi:hypothetical protein
VSVGDGGFDRVYRLNLVVDSPDAIRLISTWRLAWESFVRDLDEPNEPPPIDDEEHPFIVRWAAVSRVDETAIVRLIPLLFNNDLLFPEGRVDPLAEAFVTRRALELLDKPPK